MTTERKEHRVTDQHGGAVDKPRALLPGEMLVLAYTTDGKPVFVSVEAQKILDVEQARLLEEAIRRARTEAISTHIRNEDIRKHLRKE